MPGLLQKTPHICKSLAHVSLIALTLRRGKGNRVTLNTTDPSRSRSATRYALVSFFVALGFFSFTSLYLPPALSFPVLLSLWLPLCQTSSPHIHSNRRLKCTLISCYQQLSSYANSAVMRDRLMASLCRNVVWSQWKGRSREMFWKAWLCTKHKVVCVKNEYLMNPLVTFIYKQEPALKHFLNVAWHQGSARPKPAKPWCFA